MNEVVGNAVDVPGNADRIDKTENQHYPERHALEKIKHAKEICAVQNAYRNGDGVPPCVGKNPGIRLWTVAWKEITRTGWHSFRSPCVEIHNIDR